jgi:hypothetical protein
MKYFLAVLAFASYLFFAPDYFAEVTMQVYQLEDMTVRIVKFLVMLSGVIAFVAFTPIEWIKSANWFRWFK